MNTQLNPQPPKPVRMVTTAEGKFLSFEDMTSRMKQDGTIDDMLAVLKVSYDRGDDPRYSMRCALASFITACAGEKV